MSDVPQRGFIIDEFTRRLAAIQSQMSAQGIGALLLTTEHDIFYFLFFWFPEPVLAKPHSPLVRNNSRPGKAYCRDSRNWRQCDVQ